MMPRQFSLAVVGAPYANKDGTNREFEIRLCDRGDALALVPDPKNKYDEHAVAVLSKNGVQIGFINSERAPHVAGLLRAGHALEVLFQERTKWGCVVRIGIDGTPTLPPLHAAAPERDEFAQDDPGFEPDWIPPDE